MNVTFLSEHASELLVAVGCLTGMGLAQWSGRGLAVDSPLRKPLRLGQALLLVVAVLAVLSASTQLPIAPLAQMIHEGLNFEFMNLGDRPVTPMLIGTAVVVLIAAAWGSSWVRRYIEQQLNEREIGEPGTVAAGARLAQYLLLAIGLTVGLSTLGVDLSAVLAAGAVFAVGIGLAMQQVAENFVSGIILLVERTIRPGDVLEVEGKIVRVQHLGIRATVVRSLDDEEVIVPNSMLVQSQVKNLRLTDSLLRVRVKVGVAYNSDLRVTMKALEAAAARMPVVVERPPTVVLLGFGDSSVNFEVSVWIRDPWRKQQASSDLSFQTWDALKQAGVVIAFPQLDVHIDADVVRAMEGEPATNRAPTEPQSS